MQSIPLEVTVSLNRMRASSLTIFYCTKKPLWLEKMPQNLGRMPQNLGRLRYYLFIPAERC